MLPVLIGLAMLVAAHSTIEISLKSGTEREAQTKAQLEKLLREYDLTKWLRTTKVEIDEKAIPHSHPVLTLNAGNLGRDDHLLSEFIHEQIHWAGWNPKAREAAIRELEELFPTLPTKPLDGARDRYSSYLHLLVCYLEFEALKELIGPARARDVFQHWSGHHYRAIYRTILEQHATVKAVVDKHNLTP